MAVAEEFLRGGMPIHNLTDFSDGSYCRSYSRIRVLCALPQRWVLHKRRLHAPLLVLFFGLRAGSAEHLIRHTFFLLHADEALGAKEAVAKEVLLVWDALPAGLRPEEGLEVAAEEPTPAVHLSGRLLPRDLASAVASAICQNPRIASAPRSISSVQRSLTSLEQDAVEYVLRATSQLASHTRPSVAAAVGQLEPAILQQLLNATRALAERPQLELDPIEPPHIALRAKAVGFSVPNVADGNYAHCVALQHPPWIEPSASSEASIAIGPLQPCNDGLELRLYKDAGDAVYLCEHFSKHTIDNTENILHADGELVAQVATHMEGTAFCDVTLFAELKAPILRLHLSTPTGNMRRLTPVDSLTMELELAAPSVEMVLSFIQAAEHLMSRCARGGSGRLLVPDMSALAVVAKAGSMRRCSWCGRPRERLLRCSGCRTAYYCSKAHQSSDWKASHKAECSVLKQQAAFFEGTVAKMNLTEGPQTAVASLGATWTSIVAPLLMQAEAHNGTEDPLLVHIVAPAEIDERQPPAPVKGLIDALAAAGCFRHDGVAPVRVLLCAAGAAAVSDSSQNMSFAVDADGVNEVPPSGALGDVWNESACGGTRRSCTVKLTSERYHHFMSKFGERDSTGKPHVVVNVGQLGGEGMTFFSAPAEVFGEVCLNGRAKLVLLEPSLLALRRSQEAVIGRWQMHHTSSSKGGAATTTSLTAVRLEEGCFNERGFCRAATAGGSDLLRWNMFYRVFY
jgi:hypothetical protein